MPTNEIKPSLKEKLYQDTLDEIAQAFTGYNPEGDNATIFNWSGFIQEGNLYACGAQDRIEKAVKLAIDKTEPAARAEGYKEGQRDAANKIFKELDKQVEIGRLRIGKNAIATCGIIKVYRGSAYVESRKKWLG